MTEEELFNKYGLFIVNKKHYYFGDLTKRDLSLECSTPIYMTINNFKIEETTWVHLIPKVTNYLISTNSISNDALLKFKTKWSNKSIFVSNKKIHCYMLSNGLYIDCNNDADHSVWLLQDLLNLFGISISNVSLVIHRPSFSEPKEIKEYFKNNNIILFKKILSKNYGINQEKTNKIVKNINYYSLKISPKISKSYDDLFLFEDSSTFLSYKPKFIEFVMNHFGDESKTYFQILRYMTYLTSFYQNL